jgi:hypothetical protein
MKENYDRTLYQLPQLLLDSLNEFVGRGIAIVGCETGILAVGVGILRDPPAGLETVSSSTLGLGSHLRVRT